MESGGNLLLSDAVSLDSINVVYARMHGRQQLRGIELPEGLLRDLEQFPDQHGDRLHPFIPLSGGGPQPHGRERRLHDIRRSQVTPVFLRELIERHQTAELGAASIPN